MRTDYSYPQLLLTVLLISVAGTVLLVAGTSSASLGAYNSQWDGTSEVRAAAHSAGTATTVAQNTSAYGTLAPNETVAVVLSPTEPYRTTDTDNVRSFVRAGGTLLIAEDYGQGGNELLNDVGADARIDGRPLRDERRAGPSPAFPRVTPVANHTYTAGISELMLNHGSAVDPGTATTLVHSSEFSYLDTNRNGELDDDETLTARPVVTVESVGSGTVLVVSDPSIFLNAMLDRSDNAAFLETIVGTHDTVLLDVSHSEALPPLVTLQLFFQRSGAAVFIAGCLSVIAILTLSKPAAVRSWFRRRRDRHITPPTRSTAEISDAIRTRHPGWDDARVERVTDSLMRHRQKGETDD